MSVWVVYDAEEVQGVFLSEAVARSRFDFWGKDHHLSIEEVAVDTTEG